MTRRVRLSLSSLFAALAVAVGATAVAWACTPQAIIYLDPSSSGQAGSTITVTGKAFIPGSVEVRMGSGRPLATATGPDFSVPVRIPAAKPGVYYVKAVAYRPDGTIAGEASRALRVKAPAPEREPAVPTQQPAPRRERTQATPKQPAIDDQPAAPVETPAPAPADAEPAGADPVTAAAPVAETAKQPPAATRPAARQVPPKSRAVSPPAPAARALWSPPAQAGPSLTAAPAPDDAGALPVVGMVLVALGLAGLGGFGYALMRVRSRPPAPEPTNHGAPAISESVTRVVTIEDELQELIAAGSARAEPEESGNDKTSPRETADSPN